MKDIDLHLRGFRGEPRNPFNQFSRFISAAATIPKWATLQPEKLFRTANALMSDQFPGGNNKLLAYRILSSLSEYNKRLYGAEFSAFLVRLMHGEYWLERTFGGCQSLNDQDNIILLPSVLRVDDNSASGLQTQYAASRDVDGARDVLAQTIELIDTHVSRFNSSDGEVRSPSVLKELLSPERFSLLTTLGSMHFEASQNAVNHALRTELNTNFMKSRDASFFGDTQYIQLNTWTFLTSKPAKSLKFPSSVKQYIFNFPTSELAKAKRATKGSRFLFLSYADDGPGIVEHVRRFHNGKLPKELDMDYIIEHNISTSGVSGSGQGLMTARYQATSLGGFVYFRTGCYECWYDGVNEEYSFLEVAKEAGTQRGTLLTFIIPIFPPDGERQ